MVENLRSLDPGQIAKLTSFRNDARCIDPSHIKNSPALCFIDGEHTHDAVISDFEFCRNVAAPDSVIYFHDDIILYDAIGEIVRKLKKQGVRFKALKLGGLTFALIFGNFISEFDRTAIDGKNGQHFLDFLLVRQRVRKFLPSRITSVIGRVLRWIDEIRRH